MFNAMMWGGSVVAICGYPTISEHRATSPDGYSGSIVSSKAGIDAIAATGVEVGTY